MRVRKIAPKVLQLLTEWTETFPYDFRDERMMRSLKELTHRLASGDEVGARLFTSQTISKIMRAGIQIWMLMSLSSGVITSGVVLFCRRHMPQSYKHKQIFADSSVGCCRVKLWWQSGFWGWLSWEKSPLCSWARWVFFVVSAAPLLRQHLNCTAFAELKYHSLCVSLASSVLLPWQNIVSKFNVVAKSRDQISGLPHSKQW